MITMTRRTAHRIRTVFRRSFGMNRETGPALSVSTGPSGLRIRARQADTAAQYHEPGDNEPDQFTMPFESLDACEARNDEPVTLERQDDKVIVQWRDGAVPQLVQHDCPPFPDDFPATPDDQAENPPSLLQALGDACETTDADPARYALSCVQLRGKSGKLVATDGHQLLTQSGFQFAWDGDVLVPATKLFACPYLPTDVPVHVGRTDDWFTLVTGPWTFHIRVNVDGRFPKVEDHIRQAGSATTTLRLTDDDANFLANTIRRMPGNEAMNAPVTVDLNGQAAIRARSDDNAQTTEVVLSNSSREGAVVRFNTNRTFLARAAKLGFREIELDGAEAPAQCRDANRVYVWAVLGKDDPVRAGKNVIRIESPAATEPAVQSTTNRIERSQNPAMTASKTNPNGNGRTTQAAATETEVASPVEQAEALRDSLNDALGKTRELIRSLKRQKKQSRIVESTLASLRQLQSVDL